MGKGRPPKARGIAKVRELTPEDLADLKASQPGKVPVIQTLRDSHHKIARLIASGMRLQDVAAAVGYSIQRIYVLNGSSAMKELVEQYRGPENDAYVRSRDAYNELLWENQMLAERRVNDMLQDEDKEFSLRELLNCSRDGADRTGYGKNSVQVNINADFASVMEQRRLKSKQVIEGMIEGSSTNPSPSLPSPSLVPSPLKRRI